MGIFLNAAFVTALSLVSCEVDIEYVKHRPHVEIYSKRSYEGVMEQVNLTTNCNSVAHFLSVHEQIGSIKSKDKCIHVFQDEDCSGDFITLKPESPFPDVLALWGHYHKRVKAIGPCRDRCHETNIEHSVEATSVELFREKNFRGTSEKGTVRQKTCSVLSTHMQGVIMSFKVNPKACVELHAFENYRGGFRDFPVGSPSHINLRHWGDWWESIRVESVSLCGFRCHHTENQSDFSSKSNSDRNLHTEVPNRSSEQERYNLNGIEAQSSGSATFKLFASMISLNFLIAWVVCREFVGNLVLFYLRIPLLHNWCLDCSRINRCEWE